MTGAAAGALAARFAEIALAGVRRDRAARKSREEAARAALVRMVERLRSEPSGRHGMRSCSWAASCSNLRDVVAIRSVMAERYQ